MGTNTAAELWKQRIGYDISFYEKLKQQLDCSRAVLFEA